LRIDDARVPAHLQRQQPDGTNDQSDASHRAEQHRDAEIGIRRFPSEEIVIDGGDASGGEAQQKSIKGEMVKNAARLRLALVRISASRAVAG